MSGQGQPAASEVLAALPVAALLIDPDDRVRNANAAAEALCNRSQGAMAGRPLATVIGLPPMLERGTRDRSLAAYDIELTAGQGPLRADLAEAPIAGDAGWSIMTVHPIGGPVRTKLGEGSGGTLAAVGAAAILAHEIRNPLSGIRGAAQLLAAGADADGTALTTLITREVDRIAALIDRMQGFGDPRPIVMRATNVFPLLKHAADVARAGFAAHAQVLEAYDPSLPDALVEQGALEQVLINLLKNAAEATLGKADARIVIGAAFRAGVVMAADAGMPRRSLPIEITISDNGAGAPAAIAGHLFDPFVSGRPQGQGLGLALVDRLVRDMGGLVHYAREGDPAQTVLRLRLQRAPAA